jgi:hypothetical protein
MTRHEIDLNQSTRCCIKCSTYCNNEQYKHTEIVWFNGKIFEVTRVEPCATILEDSIIMGVGDPNCRASLQDSVNGKRN